MQDVCVIGGTRYFGKLLIASMLAAGIDVTVVNRGSAPAPPGTTHVVADREDEAALEAGITGRTFDAVIDQVCYTPVHAAIARRVFAGRTARYVMTSTIEVYNPAGAEAIGPHRPGEPVAERAVDPARWPVDPGLPWHDMGFLEAHYGEGKRQAEAVFSRAAVFPFVTVRCGHVLGGGAADFTGRLRHYVERMARRRPIDVREVNRSSSFIEHREIAGFLCWAAGADFTGAINARSHGELTVTELCERIAEHGLPRPVFRAGGEQVSPFAFADYYGMDNSRAERLGFAFSDTADWLPGAIADTIADVEAVR